MGASVVFCIFFLSCFLFLFVGKLTAIRIPHPNLQQQFEKKKKLKEIEVFFIFFQLTRNVRLKEIEEHLADFNNPLIRTPLLQL